jgi:hypothetical protein
MSRFKILSHTGIESNKKVTSQKLDVKNNVIIDNRPIQSTQVEAEHTKPPPPPPEEPETEKIEISRFKSSTGGLQKHVHRIETIELLQSILDLYTSNIMKINGELILKNSDLVELITKITDADDVEVKLDYEINCCGNGKGLSIIDRINIIKDDEVTDFQHFHNIEYNILRKYKISLTPTHD